VLALLTVATELMTRRHAADTHKAAILRNQIADSNARNAEVLKAMGFAGRAVERFTAANAEHLSLQTRTSDVSGTFGAVSRVLRRRSTSRSATGRTSSRRAVPGGASRRLPSRSARRPSRWNCQHLRATSKWRS